MKIDACSIYSVQQESESVHSRYIMKAAPMNVLSKIAICDAQERKGTLLWPGASRDKLLSVKKVHILRFENSAHNCPFVGRSGLSQK